MKGKFKSGSVVRLMDSKGTEIGTLESSITLLYSFKNRKRKRN
nr:hypothetical protein P5652_12695 [Bacillus subtilis]